MALSSTRRMDSALRRWRERAGRDPHVGEGVLGLAWEEHPDGGAGSLLAFDDDVAAALADDAVAGGEAQAGALAGALGGEEGFEESFEDFGGHSDAGVGDGDDDVVAGLGGGVDAAEASSSMRLAVLIVSVPPEGMASWR